MQILTDSGWENFDGVSVNGLQRVLLLRTDVSRLTCTPEHEVFLSLNKKKKAQSLKPGDKIYAASGTIQTVLEIKLLTDKKEVFDIINSGTNHRFFANGMLVSNCEFIIEEETLINSIKLASLEATDPIHKMGQVRWFKYPKKGNIYTVALDPSLGTGGDPSAIQVFEANSTTQVAEWRHNRTTIPEQIKILAEINKYIVEQTNEPNNLYYSLENNTIGEAALISLAEYGEENIPGTMLSEPKQMGSGRRYRKGFNTTNKTKLAACSKFKNLLESGKMTIYSQPLISELKTFVANAGSYAAKLGETDDLVMAALLSVRIWQHLQSYNVDIESYIRDHNEIIEPMPFIMSMGF